MSMVDERGGILMKHTQTHTHTHTTKPAVCQTASDSVNNETGRSAVIRAERTDMTSVMIYVC